MVIKMKLMKINWSRIVRLSLGGSMVAGILCGNLQRAEATVLAEYLFQSGNGASTDGAAGEDATAFVATGFTAGFSAGPVPTDLGGSPSIFVPAAQIPSTLSTVDYFSFTVTPDAGQRLNLSGTAALGFDYSRDSTMTTELNWAVRSSVDNYATDIATGSTSGANALNTASVNLSTAFDFQDGVVEFRFLVWTTSSTGNGFFDNVVLNGTVVPVPEPVNVALAAFGLCLAGVGVGRRFYLRSRA